jgi:DNA modification methylase
VRALLERIAQQEHLLLPAVGGLTDPDAIPEPPEKPITKPGDLWLLGEHRLMCADATNSDDVKRLMGDERAQLMVTDPPYLVDYDGGNHPPTWANGGKQGDPAAGTRHWDAYVDHDTSVAFYEGFLHCAIDGALSETPLIYMAFGMMRAPIVFAAWEKAGLLLHQILVWVKTRHVLSRSDFMWTYEPLAYGWLQGKRPEPALRPPANATAVWEIASGGQDVTGVHPTQKPAELYRQPIQWHTKPGDLIYEPFSGSGTALVAAEQTGRRCFALEQAPEFCDVAVQRWQNLTGQQASRQTGHEG